MTAVPKTPEPKKLEVAVDGEQLNIISKVRTFDGDIRSFESRIKTIKERQQEVLEGVEEFAEVERLMAELSTARDNLKRRLDGDSEWIHLTEELAEEKLSLKDAKDNMSDFLLAYFADTHEKQIELGPKEAREVVLRGRLGKAKDFQTNLFSRVEAHSEN